MNYEAWDKEYLEEIEAINDILNIKYNVSRETL